MPASKYLQRGFTLIELTIGITVLSVALLVMTGALFPQAERSTNPWFQVRSAELAQSLMNEILAREFDENTYKVGELRCGEFTATEIAEFCTPSSNFGPDAGENNRGDFDDVDDFHGLTLAGADLDDEYQGFSIDISVTTVGHNKLITVRVSPPRGDVIVYSTLKGNY